MGVPGIHPYVTNGWLQHALGDAIGDYMKTSQSAFGNSDSAMVFYNWSSGGERLTCADMAQQHHKRTAPTEEGSSTKEGYTVTDRYNQTTHNIGGGFTFALYKAEINAVLCGHAESGGTYRRGRRR